MSAWQAFPPPWLFVVAIAVLMVSFLVRWAFAVSPAGRLYIFLVPPFAVLLLPMIAPAFAGVVLQVFTLRLVSLAIIVLWAVINFLYAVEERKLRRMLNGLGIEYGFQLARKPPIGNGAA